MSIKLIAAFLNDTLVGGIVIYIFENTIKIQYIASSEIGNDHNAISFLIKYIYEKYNSTHNYLDIGPAYASKNVLNESLVSFKESFGARPLVMEEYELNIAKL